MANVKLLPCPFCGGEATISQTGYGTAGGGAVQLDFRIECTRCGATAPNGSGTIKINLGHNGNLNIFHDDRDKAAERWNRRTKNG